MADLHVCLVVVVVAVVVLGVCSGGRGLDGMEAGVPEPLRKAAAGVAGAAAKFLRVLWSKKEDLVAGAVRTITTTTADTHGRTGRRRTD